MQEDTKSGKVPRTLGTAAYGRLFLSCLTIQEAIRNRSTGNTGQSWPLKRN
jgi:hypothetical protein